MKKIVLTSIITIAALIVFASPDVSDYSANSNSKDFNFKYKSLDNNSESSLNEEVGLAIFSNKIKNEINGACEALLDEDGTLKLTNKKGKVIAEFELDNRSSFFKVSAKNIKPGAYNVELVLSNQKFSGKVFIN